MGRHTRNLSFTYPGATTPTLKNINIVIEPGETLAIVGFNGGGKTTLVKVTRRLSPSKLRSALDSLSSVPQFPLFRS